MSREAISPYILNCPDNLVISIECIFSKCCRKILSIMLPSTQRFTGTVLVYFYVKSYLESQLVKINEELRSYYFYRTFD